jgi:phospholipase D1/2
MTGRPVGPDVDDASIFQPGRNCWRVARADRLALIVDAADYFRVLRGVMAASKRELLMIGWDFDFEIEMLPGESGPEGLAPDGLPNRVGPFLEALVEREARLHIHMLKWNGAALVAPGRVLPALALKVFGDDRIHFALDGRHPFGACHHQKIVVADDAFAFCGGIDVTENRWDTSEHPPSDPRRVRKDGSSAVPWHDATTAMTGPAAATLAELARGRWLRATGDELDRPEAVPPVVWPADLPVAATDVDVAIARTEPSFEGAPPVDEIERLCIDGIARAREVIYIESQYFAAETICKALEARLREADGPEIVVINPQAALKRLEDEAMHVLRGRMLMRLRAADPGGRFRMFHPVTIAGEPIYVHAKILIVDDSLLRIGSSNLNDRSLGFDTECDVAFEGDAEAIAEFRTRLLCEHLSVSPATLTRAVRIAGSPIAAIEMLNDPEGRGLRPVERMPESLVGGFLADTRLLDPRHRPGRITRAGLGVRPRHLTLAAGAAGLGLLGWFVWRRWIQGGRRGA